MPRLAKGGKWVYGWVVVGSQGEMTIPPQAWREYGFRIGDEVLFLRGSRRSGGFGVSSLRHLAVPVGSRVLGKGQIVEAGQVVVPPESGARPGDRLLAVRGSRHALGFVAKGPIYEASLEHPDLEIF
jgi:hypothetical protein